jgi:hypothetical protein
MRILESQVYRVLAKPPKLEIYDCTMDLRSDTKFKDKLGLNEPWDMQDLLSRAHNYINYKEKIAGERQEKSKLPQKGRKCYGRKRSDRTQRRLPRVPIPEHVKREDTPGMPQHRVRRCRDPSTQRNKRNLKNGEK